jgi:hypothetical protein
MVFKFGAENTGVLELDVRVIFQVNVSCLDWLAEGLMVLLNPGVS